MLKFLKSINTAHLVGALFCLASAAFVLWGLYEFLMLLTALEGSPGHP